MESFATDTVPVKKISNGITTKQTYDLWKNNAGELERNFLDRRLESKQTKRAHMEYWIVGLLSNLNPKKSFDL